MTDDADIEDWKERIGNDSNQLYIHLGFYKTGTSYLQKYIFPNLSGIQYLNSYMSPQYIYDLIIRGKLCVTDKTLISVNALSGMPFSRSRPMDKYAILGAIKKYYPDAKIFLVFRPTKAWVMSCYAEFIKQGGLYSFKYWFKNIFDLDYLTGTYIEAVKAMFPDTLDIDFCVFKYAPDIFMRAICEYMNVDCFDMPKTIVNKRYKGYQLTIIRFFSLLGLKGRYGNPYRRWKGK